MRNIDIKELFNRLCKLEYELMKYILRTQGEDSAPINIFEAAESLSVEKDEIRAALRRLKKSGALTSEGENFQINPEVFKKDD